MPSQDEVFDYFRSSVAPVNRYCADLIIESLPKDLQWYKLYISHTHKTPIYTISSDDWLPLYGTLPFNITTSSDWITELHCVIPPETFNIHKTIMSYRAKSSELIAKKEDNILIGITDSLTKPRITLLDGNHRAVALNCDENLESWPAYIGVGKSVRDSTWTRHTYK
jgi:hypothetical protein